SFRHVSHHRRESQLDLGPPDPPPLQLLPKDAVLLHEVLDDLLLVAVDPSSEGHEPPQGRGHGLGRVFGHYGPPSRRSILSPWWPSGFRRPTAPAAPLP